MPSTDFRGATPFHDGGRPCGHCCWFSASQVSPVTFVQDDPLDPGRKCVNNVHVDNFRTVDNAPELNRSPLDLKNLMYCIVGI